MLAEDGGFAFFMESTSIEYQIERNCRLQQIGGLLDAKSYGIALPQGLITSRNPSYGSARTVAIFHIMRYFDGEIFARPIFKNIFIDRHQKILPV